MTEFKKGIKPQLKKLCFLKYVLYLEILDGRSPSIVWLCTWKCSLTRKNIIIKNRHLRTGLVRFWFWLCLFTLGRFHPQFNFTLVTVPRRNEHKVLVPVNVSCSIKQIITKKCYLRKDLVGFWFRLCLFTLDRFHPQFNFTLVTVPQRNEHKVHVPVNVLYQVKQKKMKNRYLGTDLVRFWFWLCFLMLGRFHPQFHFTLVTVPQRDEHKVLVPVNVSCSIKQMKTIFVYLRTDLVGFWFWLCFFTLGRFHPQFHFTLVTVPRRDKHEVLVAVLTRVGLFPCVGPGVASELTGLGELATAVGALKKVIELRLGQDRLD